MARVWALALFVSACAVNVPPNVVVPTPAPPITFVMPSVPQRAAAVPITLTAEDGTGLALTSLDARIDVNGPLAETKLRLRFRSKATRTIEGRFRLALPPRSFVSRLAMMMNGELREAVATPLAAARDTYESTLFVRRDPLLVEQKNDNEVTARVYPVDPGEEKEIVVGWTSEITKVVTLPLRGLPEVGDLHIAVRDENGQLVIDQRANDVPITDDFRWTPPPATASAIRSKDAFVARVRVPVTSGAVDPIGRALTVLLDTSASRAPELSATLDALDDTLGDLAREEPATRLVLAAFDQEIVPIHDGPIAALSSTERRAIQSRGALGASDLEGALRWAALVRSPRVLLVSDGLATGCSSDRKRLIDATRALGATRLDAMTLASVSNSSLLRALTSGVLASDGVVLEHSNTTRLRRKVEREVAIVIPGAKAIYPTAFHGVQGGEQRFVYAELPAQVPPIVTVGGQPAKLTVIPAKTAARAVARAHLDALVEEAEELGWSDEKRSEAMALASRHELVSPLAALIVVEPAPKTPTRSTRAPVMRVATSTVNGRLPPETIQLVVRRNAGRFRACYNEGLLRNPKLSGRVTTRLVIAADGAVATAVDGGSDLADQRVVSCIIHAFESLTFERPPAGDHVTVVYPFMLRPLGEDEAPEPEPVAALRLPNQSEYPHPSSIWERPPLSSPWTGVYERTRAAIVRGALATALSFSAEAVAHRPDDVVSLLALGESLEAAGLHVQAARAYGSIADLHPNRADMQRTSAMRLSGIGAHGLAIELLQRARRDRPDQPSNHHLLAMALFAAGNRAAAKEVLAKALERSFPARYVDATRLLSTDLAFLGGGEISPLLGDGGAVYVTTWETDASDVAIDLRGATTSTLAHAGGFGPNATIAWNIPHAMPASVRLRSGLSGQTVGIVHELAVDKTNRITIKTHPFVLMTDAPLAL